MATIQTFNNQDEDKDNQQQSGQPVEFSSASSLGMGAQSAPSAAPTVQPEKGTSSGRFTNLNRYLEANKGYKQAQGGLAGQIYGNLENKAGNIRQGFSQAQQDFQNQANQNRRQFDANLVNQAVSNASQFVGNQDNLSAFERMRDAAYGGPQDISNSNKFQNDVGNFQNIANLSGSEHGRYALLNKLYNTASYNKGQQTLDNLLLQGNQQQLRKLQEVNPMASTLSTDVTTGINQARDLASQYGQEAEATRNVTRNALGQAVTDFDAQAEAARQAAEANRAASFSNLISSLSQGKISAADAQKFGLQPGTTLYNIDPTQFATQSNFTATKQNVITPEQYAQIQALSKLSGNALSGDPTAVLSSFTDPSQANVFSQQDPYSIDTNRLMNAVNEAGRNYMNEFEAMKTRNDYLNSLGTYSIGTVYGTGNPYEDIKKLEADIAYRRTLNPDFQADYINNAQNTINTLSSLLSKYGFNPNTGAGRSIQTF
jgi:hypothetical protein